MGQSIRIRLKAGILLLVSDYTRFRYGVCGNVMLFALREAGIYHQSITHTVYQTMQVQGQTAEREPAPSRRRETCIIIWVVRQASPFRAKYGWQTGICFWPPQKDSGAG